MICRLGRCLLTLTEDEQGPMAVTRFPDRTSLTARPIPWEPHHAFADPWAQCWTHEHVHSLLAAARGWPWSPALRYAATRELPAGGLDAIRAEEADVLAIQRLLAPPNTTRRPT